jgi:hypothetical protein
MSQTGQCIRLFTLIAAAFTRINELQQGKGLIFTAVIMMILATALIAVYTALIIKNLLKVYKNKTVLHIESIQYASIYSLSFFNKGRGRFNYAYFFVLFLGIAFLSLLWYMAFSRNLLQSDKVSVTVPVIALGVAIALQLVSMILAGKDIDKVKKQTDSLDNHICRNMYKSREFLDKLRIPKRDINSRYNTIIECIDILKKDLKIKNKVDAGKLAKGFYTLTMYNYFNEFTSTKMENSKGGYDTLFTYDNNYPVQKKTCRPTGYLPRYGTLIEDIGETIIRQNMPKTSIVNEAMVKCEELVATTNKLANEIYPDMAFNVFIIMFISTLLINVLLVGTIFYYGILPEKDLNKHNRDNLTKVADGYSKTVQASPDSVRTLPNSNETVHNTLIEIMTQAQKTPTSNTSETTQADGTKRTEIQYSTRTNRAQFRASPKPETADKQKSYDSIDILDLRNKNIQQAGAIALSGELPYMLNLTQLILSDNNIGHHGVQKLATAMNSMPKLQRIDISNNNITDQHLNAFLNNLRTHNGLTHLNLNDNSIGDEGAKALAQVLPSMTELTKLDLKSNQIGDAGAAALANVLSKMNKLSYIDLSFNNIGDEGAKSFANGVKNMDNTRTVKFHLNLDNNYIHNKESISQLNTVFAAKTNLDFVLTINSQEDVNKSLMRPRRG